MASCSSAAGPETEEPQDAGGLGDVALELVAVGLRSPVFLTAPTADPRLFIVEQPGRIRIVRDGGLLTKPFLDLSDRVGYGGERGLLGMAFDPDYRATGRFLVSYTDREGTLRVERYRAVDRSDRANPGSGELVLQVPQPFENHNGGHITFGADGMLYVGLGDGGAAGDPLDHGQNPATLLGAILRLDVAELPYGIPPDNPFLGQGGPRPEIWAYGLRNPWRFSFDEDDGLLYVADVGQDRVEEVNAVPSATGGFNFGWSVMEGSACFRAECDRSGMVLPVTEYTHDEGCSVTGGYVYRGRGVPALQGRYVYADYCRGWIRTFRLEDGEAVERATLSLPSPGRVTSFGEDDRRELYVLTQEGAVYRFVKDAG